MIKPFVACPQDKQLGEAIASTTEKSARWTHHDGSIHDQPQSQEAMPAPKPPVEPPYQGFYRAGDVVRHLPTGETWSLAIDEEQGHVMPAGWPCYLAKTKEVRMIRKASASERLSTLRSWALDRVNPEMNRDYRCLIARRLLQEEAERNSPPSFMPLEDFRWAVYNDTTVSKGVTSGAPLEAIIGQLAREKAKLIMDLIEAESHRPTVDLTRNLPRKDGNKS